VLRFIISFMNPTQNTDNLPTPPADPKSDKAIEEANDKYAQALIKMVNINYAEQHPEQAKQSQFLSTKQIIFLVTMIIVTIAGSVIFSQFNKSSGSHSSSGGSTSQTKKLLNSVETFNNPKSY
jgi:hypothetical protein